MMDDTAQQQEVIVRSNKGKRTKRQRLPLVTSSSSSGGERERFDSNMSSLSLSLSSPSTSTIGFLVGEEEDMANCLILLAQGSHQKHQTRKQLQPTTTAKASYDYQCKTCNRYFPSFQALGGHRASHKKPSSNNNNNNNKGGNEEKKVREEEADHQVLDNMSTTLSLHMPNRGLYDRITSNTNILKSSNNKVHECSTCGAEFSSGQALGGHMRRHRATSMIPTTTMRTSMSLVSHHDDESSSQEFKKQRITLELDLNLPAPEDDVREPRFQFASKEQVLVFSASPLVDCHY